MWLTIQQSDENSCRTYGSHLLVSLAVLLGRAEEAVQSALQTHLPQILAVLGPHIQDKEREGLTKVIV